MTIRACACGCGASLDGLRSDATYASEACSKRARRAASPDKGRTDHPLAKARAEQEASDLNSKLGQLVYQAIIDHLAKHGEVHADDLEGSYPPEHRDRCRKLLPGQLGSLRGHKYIQPTKEYRKSKVKARKGGKSWVYVFTLKGRGLVGVGGGPHGVGAPFATSPHSGESPAGVDTNNREGQASSNGASLDRPASSHCMSESPAGARSSLGVDPGGGSSGAVTGHLEEPRPTPEPVPLFEEEQRPRSAFTDPEIEAA